MCESPIVKKALGLVNPVNATLNAVANNPGVQTLTGSYTPGPNAEEKAAELNAPRLAAEAASTSASQAASTSANAKLAARNKRRGLSLLATGAGDTGLIQPSGGKSVLGA